MPTAVNAMSESTNEREIPNAIVSFRVRDLDAAVAALQARSVEAVSPIVDAGPTRFVTLRDPAGNLVQLSQQKG